MNSSPWQSSKVGRNGRSGVQWPSGLWLMAWLGSIGPLVAVPGASPVSQDWAVQIRGPTNSYLQAADIALGPSGDVFVAGHDVSAGSDYNIVLNRHSAAGTMVWQKRFEPGDGSAVNEFSAAIAAQGTNLYVAGTTASPSGDRDFLTLKSSDTGEIEWAVRHGGPGNSTDFPVAIAVDAQGNVLVAGDSIGANGSYDLLVVKYDPLGRLLWTYRYDGPAQYADRLAGLRLDAGGNIHLAGTSDEAEGKPGIITLKLDPDGRVLWITRESSGHIYGATARAMALDAAGNVVTVGDERSHCVTWKYDPNGQRQWVARYRAEEPAAMYAAKVRFDGTGSILTAANLYGSGINDTVLVKYAQDGQQLWATRIADPAGVVHLQALEVDASGDAYLTATPTSDALTVKVGADGSQLWSTNYNSTGLYSDYGQFLQVDGSENVFVAGRSVYFSDAFVFLVKYTQQTVAGIPIATVTPPIQVVDRGTNVVFTAAATGTEPIHYQWRRNGRPIADATDATLRLANVQSVHRGDYSVAVSNPAGTTVSPEARLTVRTLPEVSIAPMETTAYLGTDTAFSATVTGNDFVTLQWRHNDIDIPGATNEILRLTNLNAAAGGAYAVVASTLGGTVTSSAAGLRISGSIELVGAASHPSYGFAWGRPPLLRVLPNGDSLIAARSNNATNRTSLMLLKQTAAGVLLWTASPPSAQLTNSEPIGLALDAAGNIYVAGLSEQPGVNGGLVILKYSPNGQLLWFRSLAGTNQSVGMVTSFAVDPDGNSTVGMLGLHGTILIRYSSAGDVAWLIYDPSPDTDTLAVAVDSSGNSYIGTTIRTNSDNMIQLCQVNVAGVTVWTRSFSEGMYNRLGALAVDASDNLIAAGTGHLEGVPDSRMLVLKYSPDGERLWVTRTGSDWAEISVVQAVVVDAAGEITVMTSSDDDYTPEHTGLARLGPDGRLRYRVREPQILVYYPSQLALDDFGNAYLTGYGARQGTGVDVVTAKYDSRGRRPWLAYHGGPNMVWEYGVAVAADAVGDIRVLRLGVALPDSSVDLSLLHYVQADPAGTFHVQLIPDAAGTFHLTAPVGETFQIEASTDLRAWTALGPEESQRLLQPGGTAFSSPQRFYRLIRTE